MKYALLAFAEGFEKDTDIKYSTLHVQECMEVLLERDSYCEPLVNPRDKPPCSSSKPHQFTRKVYSHTNAAVIKCTCLEKTERLCT